MRLIRTLLAFAFGVVVGYTIRAWDIQLPDDVASYAQKLEQMNADRERLQTKLARLQAELVRLRKLVGEE